MLDLLLGVKVRPPTHFFFRTCSQRRCRNARQLPTKGASSMRSQRQRLRWATMLFLLTSMLNDTHAHLADCCFVVRCKHPAVIACALHAPADSCCKLSHLFIYDNLWTQHMITLDIYKNNYTVDLKKINRLFCMKMSEKTVLLGARDIACTDATAVDHFSSLSPLQLHASCILLLIKI